MADGLSLEVFIRRSLIKLISFPLTTSTSINDKDRVYIDGAVKCYHFCHINRVRSNLIVILYQNVTNSQDPIIFRGYSSGLIMRIDSQLKLNNRWVMKIIFRMLDLLKQAIVGWKSHDVSDINQYTEGCSYRLNMLKQKDISVYAKEVATFNHEDLWWRTLFSVMGLKYESTLITLNQLIPTPYVFMVNGSANRLIMILPRSVTPKSIIQQTILMV